MNFLEEFVNGNNTNYKKKIITVLEDILILIWTYKRGINKENQTKTDLITDRVASQFIEIPTNLNQIKY